MNHLILKKGAPSLKNYFNKNGANATIFKRFRHDFTNYDQVQRVLDAEGRYLELMPDFLELAASLKDNKAKQVVLAFVAEKVAANS